MKSTAEVGAAVALVLTSGAGFSSGCILTTLAPNTQPFVAALLIFSAGLRGRQKKKLQLPSFSFHLANGQCQLLHCTYRKFS